ncbi:unnamed protein product [Boreogadus saida]
MRERNRVLVHTAVFLMLEVLVQGVNEEHASNTPLFSDSLIWIKISGKKLQVHSYYPSSWCNVQENSLPCAVLLSSRYSSAPY